MSKDIRQRYYKWTFVIYPEDSAPENWKDIISNWHIPCCCSPIHDKDLNGDDTEKKKHIHIFLDFTPIKKSYEDVVDLIKNLNGTIPQRVQNEKGLIRYFVHFDNPEKHQYNIKDLISISGYEYIVFFNNSNDEDRQFQFIESYITEHKICNLIILIQSLRDDNQFDTIAFIRRHTFYVKCMLDSMYQLLRYDRQEEVKVEKDI